MKHHLIWAITSLMLCVAGVWFGYQIQNPTITWESTTIITCGGGDYSKEAFTQINDESDAKIRELLGSENAEHCHVLVIPGISGYRTRIIANHASPIYEEEVTGKIQEWIMMRMDEIQSLEDLAQQDGADQPTTAPKSKSSDNESPNPESKPRPQ